MAAAYEKSDVRAREMKRLAAVETTLEQVDEDFHAAALKMNQVRSETEVGFFHAFSTFFRCDHLRARACSGVEAGREALEHDPCAGDVFVVQVCHALY